jgi:Ca2+-transporting ATPase
MQPPSGKGWYNLAADESVRILRSSPQGLSGEEAARRLAEHGPNLLRESDPISPFRIFLSQFLNTLVVILILAAVVSAALGIWNDSHEEMVDAVVIFAIVILNAVFGFIQEYRAEKGIRALKQLAAPQAKVMRDGVVHSIPASGLVPGDLVLLDAGDRVPADLRLLEVVRVKVHEASLTGESAAVMKDTDPISGSVQIGDRRNMLMMGCTLEEGRARALVVTTGMDTELGKIAEMVQEESAPKTPLQIRLTKLAHQLGYATLAIAAVLFLVGWLRGMAFVSIFLTSVSLAVAAIPEGLPAVVTITLAIGLQRLLRRNALLRRLSAAETLGSTSVICSDKTGTLTLGEMNIREIFTPGATYLVEGKGFVPEGDFFREGEKVAPLEEPVLPLLLRTGVLCSNATLVREESFWNILGDTGPQADDHRSSEGGNVRMREGGGGGDSSPVRTYDESRQGGHDSGNEGAHPRREPGNGFTRPTRPGDRLASDGERRCSRG